VLNAAARVVSGTRKFDRSLTHLLHCELHWLDVSQRIQFKDAETVRRCLQGDAPQYKFGRRAFSVADPTDQNSLPDYFHDPSLSEDILGDR